MADQSTIQPAVLSEPDAACYVGLSRATLKRRRADGTGPQPIELSERRIGYLRADLDCWLEGRRTAGGRDPSATAHQGQGGSS